MSSTFRTIAKLIVGCILLVSAVDGVSARDSTPAAGIIADIAPPVAEPTPTPEESLTASDLTEYADLLLLFSGPDVTPQTFIGQICVQVNVNPPLSSGSWVGTMCESSTPEITTWHSSEYTSLPVTSTYSVTVISNASDCTAEPVPGIVEEIDGDNVYGRLEVRIVCPAAPAVETFSLLQLYLQDLRGGGGSFYYPGDLCVDVHVDPPLPTGPLVASKCDDVSPSGASWFPPDFPDLPITSTYTATITSNDTGCDAIVQHQIHGDVVESGGPTDGGYRGMILVYIDCLGTWETPEPTVPSDATTVPGFTDEPTPIVIPRSTTGPIWTVVPDSSPEPTSTIPPGDPAPTAVTIIGLPNTGSGGVDSGVSLILLFAGACLIALGIGAIRQKRHHIH